MVGGGKHSGSLQELLSTRDLGSFTVSLGGA